MTKDSNTLHTDWENVDAEDHVRRSAATYGVVKGMEDALGRDHSDLWHSHFSPDLQWRGNVGCGVKTDYAQFIRNWVDPIHAAFADRNYTTERFLADGDWASCVGILEATHVGTFMGIAPTGKRVKIPYMDFWHVRNGRIADNPVFVDFASLCLQLGRDVFGGEGWEAYDRAEREAPHP